MRFPVLNMFFFYQELIHFNIVFVVLAHFIYVWQGFLAECESLANPIFRSLRRELH